MEIKFKEYKEKARIITPKFRVSYAHVWKPNRVKPTDDPKYSITMLFPKDESFKPIQRAIKMAKAAAFGPGKANWPDGLISPITDGDDPKFANKEGYKGHWVVKASTSEDQKPGVMDEMNQTIIDHSKFYSGCFARAQVYAYVWEYMGRQGVSFILDHVQKWGDGPAFGGKKPADQVFSPLSMGDDFDDEAEADFA